jgi:hypothetical protein
VPNLIGEVPEALSKNEARPRNDRYDTLGNMRANGAGSLLVYCSACRHRRSHPRPARHIGDDRGEGVVVDDRGVTDFECLRSALGRPARAKLSCKPSTCLSLMARIQRRHPLEVRRATLTGLLRQAGSGIRLSRAPRRRWRDDL